ncbi:MAG: DUF2147 domain-containing protein [Bacteroidia bacterium]|jgi:uncharacterized protein (DUF2147 family)|nr:DUF2147 domain-containing protein [Sphingobacteriaceae bacterium]MBK7818545.1 DUF2147 domain-containing protein [Sphingobacteriaceae bacterium]MBP9069099.1 DUF2147 domain-containing protein [Bacteroidia bacterium]
MKTLNQPTNLTQKVTLLLAFVLFSFIAGAQNKAGDVVGNYLVPSKDGAIQIYEKAGKYYGKIILNKDPNKLDVNNPDKAKQSRKTLGLDILNDFVFDGDDTWEKGTIYDPKNGKTYSCKITRLPNGDLNIRGFVGVSLLGRTETFTKLNPTKQ